MHRQIACADVVLLNKTDVAPEERIKSIEEQISSLNPTAIVHRTVRGQIDLKHLLGINAYTARMISTPVVDTHCDHNHSDDDGCNHHSHQDSRHYELRGISSLQIGCPVLAQSRLAALDEWIRTLLWESRLPDESSSEPQITVLRCKGMFRDEMGKTYVLQGVRDIYDIASLDSGSDELGIPDEGKLVFIGKGLGERVRRSLTNVLYHGVLS
jgi:G3E family GTPase